MMTYNKTKKVAIQSYIIAIMLISFLCAEEVLGVNEKQKLETTQSKTVEEMLRQTLINLNTMVPMDVVTFFHLISRKSGCDVFYKAFYGKKAEVRDVAVVPEIDNDFGADVVDFGRHVAVKLNVTNAPAYDLLYEVANKAGLSIEIEERGIIIGINQERFPLTIRISEKDVLKTWDPKNGVTTTKQEPDKSKEAPEKTGMIVTTNTLASAIVNDDTFYTTLVGDFDAPTRMTNPPVMQFKYEAIYIVPSHLSHTNGESYAKALIRISPIGKRRSPVWNRKGDKIAYIDLSGGWKRGKIVVLDMRMGRQQTFTGTGVSGDLSWDESGEHIAFDTSKKEIGLLDVNTGITQIAYKGRGERTSLSPDGQWICFMTRDLPDPNDTDGWLLNVVDIKSKTVKKISTTDDSFGVIGGFYWAHDSGSFVFRGLELNEDGKRTYRSYRYLMEPGRIVPHDFQSNKVRTYHQTVRYWGSK